MLIEYGHIYYEDIINQNIDEDDIIKSINIAKDLSARPNCVKTVLIDDKDYSLTKREKSDTYKFISDYYESLGLKPNLIYFEKSFRMFKNNLYDRFDKDFLVTESFRRDNKRVEFLLDESRKIPLRQIFENGEDLTCQFLASIWSLCKSRTLSDNNVLTILNKKYAGVEDDIDVILSKAGYDGLKNTRIYYE